MLGDPSHKHAYDWLRGQQDPNENGSRRSANRPLSSQEICDGLSSHVIPASIRRRLSDEQYHELENLVLDRAARDRLALSDEVDGRWGDQREED